MLWMPPSEKGVSWSAEAETAVDQEGGEGSSDGYGIKAPKA